LAGLRKLRLRMKHNSAAGICFLVLFVPSFALATIAQGPCPITALRVHDTPGDGGGSITLRWEKATGSTPAAGGSAIVQRSTSPGGPFETLAEMPAALDEYTDLTTTDGTAYYYRLACPAGGDTLVTAVAGPVVSRSNWFRTERTNALILFLLMFVLVNLYIRRARHGKDLFIRRIAGLSALDEAVGRATEMGKKMLYIPGIMSLSEIQTIASLSILAYVAKQAAVYGAFLEVPNTDPLTFTAARETVKQAYMEAGKPDQFKEEMVTYITYDQFAYAASVSGKMVRERPATNFLIGSFYAEALIFAETGQSVGAIQIAGTADVTQLPFFVTACDYTLMGEELYAASAYLSREPVLLGSIKAQDVIKAVLLVVTGAGIIAYAFGWQIIRNMLMAR
jgi:Domain of unknown function (DUF6754)